MAHGEHDFKDFENYTKESVDKRVQEYGYNVEKDDEGKIYLVKDNVKELVGTATTSGYIQGHEIEVISKSIAEDTQKPSEDVLNVLTRDLKPISEVGLVKKVTRAAAFMLFLIGLLFAVTVKITGSVVSNVSNETCFTLGIVACIFGIIMYFINKKLM